MSIGLRDLGYRAQGFLQARVPQEMLCICQACRASSPSLSHKLGSSGEENPNPKPWGFSKSYYRGKVKNGHFLKQSTSYARSLVVAVTHPNRSLRALGVGIWVFFGFGLVGA